MNDLTQTLRELVVIFDQLGIAYAVMGGMAVRVHGIPRPTHDLDFTLAIEQDRLPELFARLADEGFTVPEPYQQGWVDRVADMPLVKLRIYLGDRGVDVDLFLAESAFQREIMSRRRRARLDAQDVWIVTPEDLLLLKLLAGRPRDLSDAGDILFVQGQLDQAYLKRWAAQLGIDDRLRQLLGPIES